MESQVSTAFLDFLDICRYIVVNRPDAAIRLEGSKVSTQRLFFTVQSQVEVSV